MSRPLALAATIIRSPDKETFVMHQRKKGRDTGEVDRLGLYGGSKETKDRSFKETAIRELEEESGFRANDDLIKKLGTINTVSERQTMIPVRAKIFYFPLPKGFDVSQFEHSQIIAEQELAEAIENLTLTTVAIAAFNKYLEVIRNGAFDN